MFFRSIIQTFTIFTKKPKSYRLIRHLYTNEKTFNKSSDFIEELDDINEDYELIKNKCFLYKEQNCFIIHPYVKWGLKKRETSKEYDIDEAESLVATLTGWKVTKKLLVPVENLDKKTIFGSGTLQNLKKEIRSNKNITAVFINVGILKNVQINELESIFGVSILDRYKIVIHILKQHAQTKHAKLQVALAEIPYLRSRLKYLDITTTSNWKVRDKMLQEREQKLKNSIKKLRNERHLLRNKRRDLDFPVVAVVGYTNVGKTSLIKCLTGDINLQPKDKLFATLDVTVHSGVLTSKLEVLYVDTVGFVNDIPIHLIECFIATLEDAILADVILHVQDVSNENANFQRQFVDSVLANLSKKIGNNNLGDKLIYVGNKCDQITSNIDKNNLVLVSAKTLNGLENLKQKIENVIMSTTSRLVLTLRLPTGGHEIRWLFKNSTVVEQNEDLEDCQFQKVKIIITQRKLKQFEQIFVT